MKEKMKTLVNKDNPVVRITAPEIQVRSDSYYFLINENYGFIIPKARWTLVEQEQPEVELSADIEMEWDSFNKHVAEYGEDVVWLNWLSFVDIATHFYKLGLNARKEE